MDLGKWILPQAARLLVHKCRFVVVGDGGMRRELEAALASAGVENVRLLDPVPRSRLLELYAEADYLLLHLNDHAAFEKVLPSKIFEYAATGKPILAGVAGYARSFILENVAGAAVFAPCDPDGLVQAFCGLAPERVDRRRFVERFRRKSIMQGLAADILELARRKA